MQQAQYMHRVCTTWALRLHSPRTSKRLFPHAFSEALSTHIISRGKQQHFPAAKRMQTAENRPLGMWVYHVGQPTFTYNQNPPFPTFSAKPVPPKSIPGDCGRRRSSELATARPCSSLCMQTSVVSPCGNSHWRGLTTSLGIFVCGRALTHQPPVHRLLPTAPIEAPPPWTLTKTEYWDQVVGHGTRCKPVEVAQ